MKKKPFLTVRRSQKTQSPSTVRNVTRIVVGATLLFIFVLVARSVQQHDARIAWRGSLEEGIGTTPWPDWQSTWPPAAAEASNEHQCDRGGLLGPVPVRGPQ